ncbi:cilia- and flagella-associated protein 77 isoform X2 [Hemicordylus capensis]|uniref:cilia- and flagella-associated protein 77 isoform X2 n=1 Tax=Hemicordylus capensis TaxID=884348 RepID=UPI00230434C3|nr:cilia- and flagella-associated protein 77 isoform X2 [Hemicordylus capensis]
MAAMAALAPKPDPVARKPAAGALKALKKDRLPRRRSVSQICPPPRRPMTLGELSRGGENERVGVVRETMLQNHLIAKPEVGKPRRSCYTLPGYAFNYGLYLHGVDGGVAEAIGHWNAIKPRPPSAKTRGRDYVTMSRRAIQEGYVTPHEQHLYRKLKEIHLSDDDERRFKRNPPNVPADMTYGRPARHAEGKCTKRARLCSGSTSRRYRWWGSGICPTSRRRPVHTSLPSPMRRLRGRRLRFSVQRSP